MASALGTVDFGVTSVAVGAHKSVGVYFGSFDPPHENHVALARHAVRYYGLGCVVFVASPCLLTKPTLSPLDVRVAMLQARLRDEPSMAVYLHGAAPLDLSLRDVANRDAVCTRVDRLCRRASPLASACALPPECDESASALDCARSARGEAEPTRGEAVALHDNGGHVSSHVQPVALGTTSLGTSTAQNAVETVELVSTHDGDVQHNSSAVHSTSMSSNRATSFGDDGTATDRSHLMKDTRHQSHHIHHEAPTLGGHSACGSGSCASAEPEPNDTADPPVFQLIGGDKVGAWARCHFVLDQRVRGRMPSLQEQGHCWALVFPRDGCNDKTRAHYVVAGSKRYQSTFSTHRRMHVVDDYRDPHLGLSSTSVRRTIRGLSHRTNASSNASPSSKPITPSELNDLAQRCGVHPAVLEIALAHALYNEAVSDASGSPGKCTSCVVS